MKSIAGSIVVLAGAILMGLAADEIPNEQLPTLVSIGLVVTGLIVLFTDNRKRHEDLGNLSDRP